MFKIDISESELQYVYDEVLTFLGGYTVDVELTKEEVLKSLNRALAVFEREISLWQITNQWSNLYGQVQGNRHISQFATINFGLVQQVTDWFATMGRYGGKIPWHKDYITLESGRQIYNLATESSQPYLPGTRRIHKVMWVANANIFTFGKYTPSNPTGDDVLVSNNWALSGAGLSYAGNRLGLLGSVSDVVMLLQARETLSEVLFSEFFYNLSGDMLEVTPMPSNTRGNAFDGMRVYYYYWDEGELAKGKNIDLEIYPELIDPETGMIKGEYSLIANPLDIKLNVINWSDLSPWATSFVFDYGLALCKYIVASKWRMIQKTMGEGDKNFEINLDYSSLLSEYENETGKTLESLKAILEKFSLSNIYQEKLNIFEATKRINTGNAKRWQVM